VIDLDLDQAGGPVAPRTSGIAPPSRWGVAAALADL